MNGRCKNFHLASLFPARTVAIGCLYLVMENRGLRPLEHSKEWLDDITSRKVHIDDFEEVLEVLRAG